MLVSQYSPSPCLSRASLLTQVTLILLHLLNARRVLSLYEARATMRGFAELDLLRRGCPRHTGTFRRVDYATHLSCRLMALRGIGAFADPADGSTLRAANLKTCRPRRLFSAAMSPFAPDIATVIDHINPLSLDPTRRLVAQLRGCGQSRPLQWLSCVDGETCGMAA